MNKLSTKTYLDYDPVTKTVIASYYSDIVDEQSPRSVPIGNSVTLEVLKTANEERTKHIENAIQITKKREAIVTIKNQLKMVIQKRII